MTTAEDIEKVRQEIMRFRELLNIMRKNLEYGERTYANLFSGIPPEEVAGTKEKDLQWKLAEKMVADTSQLSRFALQMRFAARDLEKAFEELHDIIVSAPNSE